MKEIKIAVYNRNSYHHYLITHVAKTANIAAKIRQGNDAIMKSLAKERATHIAFHVDMSSTEGFFQDKEGLRELLDQAGITTINALLSDIRKDTLQKHCILAGLNSVSTEIPEAKKVIIKSKLNFNGIREHRLTKGEKGILGLKNTPPPMDYKIIPKEQLKSESVDPNAQVEQFIENERNLFYRAYKMFDRLVVSEVTDASEIKKMPIGIERKNFLYDLSEQNPNDQLHPIVSQIDALSKSMNIEYAAFDVVASDKPEYYIIDVNHTPFWGALQKPKDLELVDHLRAGVK